MKYNNVTLNADKIHLIIIGTKQQWDKLIKSFQLNVIGRNLSFYQHISQVWKSFFYHIHDLAISYNYDNSTALVAAFAIATQY